MEAIKTIQNKYADLTAKLNIDFARQVAPVVDSYADLLRSISLNENCNTDCVYNELRVKRQPLSTSLSNCGCSYPNINQTR